MAAQTGGDGARLIEAVKSGERTAARALLDAGAEANVHGAG